MSTVQEEFEQEIIGKSITIDYTSKRVMVDLPFVRPPVEFLTKKHGRVDNFTQALRESLRRSRSNYARHKKAWLITASWSH
jgi:hypothetical protein